MTDWLARSIDGVADVSLLRGSQAPPGACPDLLVEVPHGADRRADYDALRSRLVGDLPHDLHEFFHFNTDVGAWAYGHATAEAIVRASPGRSALLVRCRIPRTLIDCNRVLAEPGAGAEAAAPGRLTAGLPAYVRDPRDQALLRELHARYVGLVESAYQEVCGGGGLALVPHTYGPRSIDLARIDDDVVGLLREALAPGRETDWPLRPEIDLLTRDADGKLLAPPGIEEELLRELRAAGFESAANATYCLQPPALGHQLAAAHPGQVLCLEVRRDQLAEWRPFAEMSPDPERVARVAAVLAPVLARRLAGQRRA